MGNSTSLEPYKVSHLENQHLWELQAQKQHCKIFRNLKTGSLCEEYIIQLPSGQIKQDIEIYQDRYLTTHNNIVKVYYANYHQSPSLCSTNQIFRIRTEPIPYRLNELNPLSNQESLFVLVETLSGFAEIVYRYSFVRVEPDMIGLSSDGKIKVWLNPNYSKCFPEDYALFSNIDDESSLVNQMIKEIYNIVEAQSRQRPLLPINIKNRILKETNFQNAINIVKQSINFDLLSMTSVNLPGNSLKEAQLQRTKYSPLSATMPSPPNPSPSINTHRQSLPNTNSLRPSYISREQTKVYRQNNQPESPSPKTNVTHRRSFEHPRSFSIANLPTSRGMQNQFPAQFVQSQLVRQPKVVNNRATADLAGQNSIETQHHFKGSQPIHQRFVQKQPQVSPRITVQPPANVSNQLSSETDFHSHTHRRGTQNYVQNHIRHPQTHNIHSVLRNRNNPSIKQTFNVQPIYESNPTLNETARFTLIEPPSPSQSFNKPPIHSPTPHYASDNFTINVLPPSKQSRMRQTRNYNQIGSQYVNSSFVPNIINMSPSQVVNSTPVNIFSNIQYGHGVVRNRQPRNRE